MINNVASDATPRTAFFGRMACASCHGISGTGGKTGPNLTSIGTTFSAERIAKECLWPHRQLKEGCPFLLVVTDQGTVDTGIERTTPANRDAGEVIPENLATQERIAIKHEDLEEKRTADSPPPSGLTAVLPRSQLLELNQYLSQSGAFR